MKFDPTTTDSDDVRLATRLAKDAGDLLLKLRSASPLTSRSLGDAADHEANVFLQNELARERPDDAVLSEETTDDFQRLAFERIWIIDPLDGTREYREGRDDWAVHIALIQSGAVIAAAVSIPSRGEVFSSVATQPPKLKNTVSKIVVSRSRPPEFAPRIAQAVGAEVAQVGSAGAKAMMVVRGDAVAYAHEGGLNEWDAAAPIGVALAHGLHVSDLRGNAITFNHRDIVLRDGLLICSADVAQTILGAL